MPVTFNLRHLEDKVLEDKVLHLLGELPASELELATLDELIQVTEPVSYDLAAQKLDKGVLIQGRLQLVLNCECVRCLAPFRHPLDLPHWSCHLALEGEEKALVVNDCVDLTPYLREDIVLAFPQHPLCKPECRGLVSARGGRADEPGGVKESRSTSSAWAELNKLKI